MSRITQEQETMSTFNVDTYLSQPFSAVERAGILDAVTAHINWSSWAAEHNCNKASLTKSLYLQACDAFGLDAGAIAADALANPKPESTPRPAPSPHIIPGSVPTPGAGDPTLQAALAVIMGAIQKPAPLPELSEGRIIELIREHGASPRVTLDIRGRDGNRELPEALVHYQFPALLSALAAGCKPMLVGPAGSGKTTAAAQAAKALGLSFAYTGAISSAYKLLGYMDGHGRYVRTPFRDAYEHGGTFLFDEIDASAPNAVAVFNGLLEAETGDFPDGMVKRHPNFYVIAAANTFGEGASSQYVGRYQQDAASLDRFISIYWGYDPGLEAAANGLPRPRNAPAVLTYSRPTDDALQVMAQDWLQTVHRIREQFAAQGVKALASPRAVRNGIALLGQGWPRGAVLSATIWRGLAPEQVAKVAQAANALG
jgi:hypothetical protein